MAEVSGELVGFGVERSPFVSASRSIRLAWQWANEGRLGEVSRARN